MKQRTSVRAIIRDDDRILLLKRHGGRPSIQGLLELPGGRIHSGQQPEDALAHALRIHLGVEPETTRLHDVITFVDPHDREVQYLFVVYETALKSSDRTVQLGPEYNKYVWKKLSEIQLDEITQSSRLLLGLQAVSLTTGEQPTLFSSNDEKTTTKIIAYSDGGSRGNPGPAASGFVLLNDHEELISEGGAYLGITTNNVAEYQALYLGLEKALSLKVSIVDFRLDSLLVVNQMNGIYKIKNSELLPIHNRIKELSKKFDSVTYTHVRREYNKLADAVVNRLLDAAASSE